MSSELTTDMRQYYTRLVYNTLVSFSVVSLSSHGRALKFDDEVGDFDDDPFETGVYPPLPDPFFVDF